MKLPIGKAKSIFILLNKNGGRIVQFEFGEYKRLFSLMKNFHGI